MGKRPAPSSGPTAESRDDSGNFAFAPAEPEEAPSLTELEADSILSIAEDARRRAEGSDPYNRASPSASKNKNRSLDDMRELSEAIKSAPTWTPPEKTTALAQRVAALGAQLELALAELGNLSSGLSDPADCRAGELKQQLVRAANYVEEALDCLPPPGAVS